MRPSTPASMSACTCSPTPSGSPAMAIARMRSFRLEASRRATASSWRSARKIVAMRVFVISAGSRPTSSQCRSRTPSRCRTASRSPKTLQPSAYCATRRQRLPLARAADEDRDVTAQRLRVVQRVGDGQALALVARLGLREHPTRDVERVLEQHEAVAQRGELVAVREVLLLEPRRPDAEEHAPARDHVERGRDLGHERRVAIRHAADQEAQVEPRRARREPREGRGALEHELGAVADARDLMEVVHHGDAAVAGRLARGGDVDELLEQAVGAGVRVGEAREVERERERNAHSASVPAWRTSRSHLT